jgi:hypothetical protein
MTTRLLVGDVFDRMAELENHSFDLIVTSPPFLALRSYLPDDHPDKAKEIGSEATPAEYLDTLLALTAEWRRLLAPHGSIAVELGDTYAGSGGAGGDYDPDGLRDGQARFDGSAKHQRAEGRTAWERDHPIQLPREHVIPSKGPGWPLDKSLTGIPTLYAWSLAYGRNLLTGQPSPAGRWRVRNVKPWIRSNPPVGALGDKERPATSYITVACTGSSRWFDLDAVRTPYAPTTEQNKLRGKESNPNGSKSTHNRGGLQEAMLTHGGAPPLDWWHPVDAVIDRVLDERAGKIPGGPVRKVGISGASRGIPGGDQDNPDKPRETGYKAAGARGYHIRRALEAAGLLPHGDYYDVSPKGYAGAHYAVWPPELVRLMISEMCPRQVCVVCGEPSRRLTEASYEALEDPVKNNAEHKAIGVRRTGDPHSENAQGMRYGRATKNTTTLGWSDCGHNAWRPGRVLDPFAGSGTTMAVASGMGRDSVGLDLDPRSADLASERVGMFLEIDYGTTEATA